MRLIRMTTVDPNCIFDETLHQDVKIAPNSSIALKNITLEADTSLTINGSNDNITYELTAGNPNVAYLTHRTYTNQDADGNALDKDITNALNREISCDGPIQSLGALQALEELVGLKYRPDHLFTHS